MAGRKCFAVDKKIFTGNFTKKILLLIAIFLGLQATVKGCGASGAEDGRGILGNAMLVSLANETEYMLYRWFVPSILYNAESSHRTYWLLQEQIDSLIPFYGYAMARAAEAEREVSDSRTMRFAETLEGELENLIPHTEGEAESGRAGSVFEGDELSDMTDFSTAENLQELLQAENEAAFQVSQAEKEEASQGAPEQTYVSAFVPHVLQSRVDLESLKSYETLVKQFYTVDASTMANSDLLNVDQFLEKDMSISMEGEGPQILIYHTHSQEAFADSVPGDPATTIMGVGDQLARILTEVYGYEVLHHTGQYDVKTRDDAYSKALPEIQELLEENPSIQVVIDLHRDAMPESTRLVTELDGRPTARFMFFNGISRTRNTGEISYLYNENLEDNLAFSFQMQLKAAEYYPGLTRKIYLKSYRYNMHLNPRYLLIELGAQNNTLEEVMNACDPLAHILDLVLRGE